MIMKIVLTILFVVAIIYNISMIDETRADITRGDAIVAFIIYSILIMGIWIWIC